MKDIQTHNAKIDLIKKLLDYANVADASYALLHYIQKNAENDIKNNVFKADGLNFKDKLENDINFEDKINNKKYTKPKGTNTAYACAIEARFNEDRTGDWCIPFANKCLTEKNKISNNDITKVKPDSKLSQRTIDFVNRFRLLAHQENKERNREKGKETDGNYGFSATLFGEKRKQTNTESKEVSYTADYGYTNYTLSIRGTEFKLEQIQDLLNDYYIGTNNDRKAA